MSLNNSQYYRPFEEEKCVGLKKYSLAMNSSTNTDNSRIKTITKREEGLSTPFADSSKPCQHEIIGPPSTTGVPVFQLHSLLKANVGLLNEQISIHNGPDNDAIKDRFAIPNPLHSQDCISSQSLQAIPVSRGTKGESEQLQYRRTRNASPSVSVN